MKLTALPYNKIKNKHEVKHLYCTAFPRHERMPWHALVALTLKRNFELLCFYHNNKFCGFAYVITNGSVVYLLFFAVAQNMRSNGYGSAILEHLKTNNPNKSVVVIVEPLDDDAENKDQRKRRMAFYQKNGFFDTKLFIKEIGGVYAVLSTGQGFNTREYIDIYKKMSFGLWRPRLKKER